MFMWGKKREVLPVLVRTESIDPAFVTEFLQILQNSNQMIFHTRVQTILHQQIIQLYERILPSQRAQLEI